MAIRRCGAQAGGRHVFHCSKTRGSCSQRHQPNSTPITNRPSGRQADHDVPRTGEVPAYFPKRVFYSAGNPTEDGIVPLSAVPYRVPALCRMAADPPGIRPVTTQLSTGEVPTYFPKGVLFSRRPDRGSPGHAFTSWNAHHSQHPRPWQTGGANARKIQQFRGFQHNTTSPKVLTEYHSTHI